MSTGLLTILAAEDEETDGFFLKMAFEQAGILHRVVIARDGQAAVEYLAGKGSFANRAAHPLPALIILDLKMPRMNGFDVLAWLETQPDFKNIPAVVLSSSADEADVHKARKLGAREYFVKPFAFSELVKIVGQMQTQWLAGTTENRTALST